MSNSAMRWGGMLLLVIAGAWSGPLGAHALRHEVIDADAVIVRFQFAGADQPWFEPYEVYAPGTVTPFQAGRVNARGEISFRPDQPGTWQVKLFTADGHGTVVEVAVDEAGTAVAAGAGDGLAHAHWPRVLAGIGYLLGAFGLLALWRGHRARARPG